MAKQKDSFAKNLFALVLGTVLAAAVFFALVSAGLIK